MGCHSSECSIFSCVLQDTTPPFVHPSVSQLVGWLVSPSHFTFYDFYSFTSSYPNGQVTSNMAPAHPHTTGVAVDPAVFLNVTYFRLNMHTNATFPFLYAHDS